MARTLHHSHALHQAHRARSPQVQHGHWFPTDSTDWAAAIMLVFGLGLIGYAILHTDKQAPADQTTVLSRPSTYD